MNIGACVKCPLNIPRKQTNQVVLRLASSSDSAFLQTHTARSVTSGLKSQCHRQPERDWQDARGPSAYTLAGFRKCHGAPNMGPSKTLERVLRPHGTTEPSLPSHPANALQRTSSIHPSSLRCGSLKITLRPRVKQPLPAGGPPIVPPDPGPWTALRLSLPGAAGCATVSAPPAGTGQLADFLPSPLPPAALGSALPPSRCPFPPSACRGGRSILGRSPRQSGLGAQDPWTQPTAVPKAE